MLLLPTILFSLLPLQQKQLPPSLLFLQKSHIPAISSRQTPAPVDVDGDGDLDLVFPGLHSRHILINDGKAHFKEVFGHLPTSPFYPPTLGCVGGDVDQDGDMDLLFAGWGQNLLFLNDGKGNFKDVTKTHLPQDSHRTIQLLLLDIDLDGDLDLVAANSDAKLTVQNRIYVNNGQGVFSDRTKSIAPKNPDRTIRAFVQDLDGDGIQDLFFLGNSSIQTTFLFWKGDGRGGFTDKSKLFPQLSLKATGATFMDVDQDKDLDILLGVVDSPLHVLRNDGAKGFVDVTTGFFASTPLSPRDILALDIDFDYSNKKEVLVLQDRGPLVIFKANNGRPKFINIGKEEPVNLSPFRTLLAEDFNGDGRPEILRCNPEQGGGADIMFYFHRWFPPSNHFLSGSPGLVFSWRGFGRNNIRKFYMADLDGDGDPDLLDDQFQVYWGWGGGEFRQGKLILPTGTRWNSYGQAFGDLDGDGRLDLLLTDDSIFSPTQGIRILLNRGPLGFQDATSFLLPTIPWMGLWVETLDLDGDGDLDFLSLGAKYSPKQLQFEAYLNDGKARFKKIHSGFPVMKHFNGIRPPILFDLDGDGDKDLVFVDQGKPRCFIHQGKGVFKEEKNRIPSISFFVTDGTSGDADGDGDLDLIFWGYQTSSFVLLRNKGKGFFAKESHLPKTKKDIQDVFVTELNDDGKPDLLILPGMEKLVLLGDGKGGFTPDTTGRLPKRNGSDPYIAAFDVDADGDLDLLTGKQIAINTQYQLQAPYIPLRKGKLTLDFFRASGHSKRLSAAIPLFGTKAAQIPLPGLGTLRIHPQGMFTGSPLLLPSPQGFARAQYPLLRGVWTQFFVQGLFLESGKSGTRLKLSNRIRVQLADR